MRKCWLLSFVLFCWVLPGFSQEFVNKVMKYADNDKRLRLDYIENTENNEGEMVTRVYLKFIPRTTDSDYLLLDLFSELSIRERKRGNYYRVKEGRGVSVRADAYSFFHTKGGEIGFSIDFEHMAEKAVKTIEIYNGQNVAFSNIAIDTEKDKVDDSYFRFQYTYTTISFYTNVTATAVNFKVDDALLQALKLKPRTTGTPATCASGGTVSFLYNREVRREINFNIKAYSANTAVGEWAISSEPSFGCKFLSFKK